MVSPVLANAILNLKGPDILGSFEKGQEISRKKRVRKLSGQVVQQGGGESLTELQGLAPEIALTLQNQIGARTSKDLNDFVKSAGIARRMLESGQTQGALQFANQRLQILSQQGRDTTQTQRIRDLIASGQTGVALQELTAFDDSLRQAKQISLKPSAPVEFQRADGTIGLGIPTINPVTGQTDFKEVPVPAGFKLTTRRETPTEVSSKALARETGKLQAQFKLQPQVASAVVQAKKTAEAEVAKVGEQRSNERAFNTYNTAVNGLSNALSGTVTGPFAGFVPSITSNQQIADGAVAAMAPILKSLFRTAGEGTFTDKDQELLTKMIPTRKDSPAARVSKLSNIDAIIRAKLGQPPAPAAAPPPPAPPGGVKFLGFE